MRLLYYKFLHRESSLRLPECWPWTVQVGESALSIEWQLWPDEGMSVVTLNDAGGRWLWPITLILIDWHHNWFELKVGTCLLNNGTGGSTSACCTKCRVTRCQEFDSLVNLISCTLKLDVMGASWAGHDRTWQNRDVHLCICQHPRT